MVCKDNEMGEIWGDLREKLGLFFRLGWTFLSKTYFMAITASFSNSLFQLHQHNTQSFLFKGRPPDNFNTFANKS